MRPTVRRHRWSQSGAGSTAAAWTRATGWSRALAEERMRGLEIELIEDHGLTLPPATYPWTEGERRSEVRSRRMTLERVPGGTHPGPVAAPSTRRILTAGLWR